MEWIAYQSIEPHGPERDEIHAAMIASTVAQQWSKRRMRLDQFRLDFGPNAKERSKPKDLKQKLRSIAMALGAKIVERKG